MIANLNLIVNFIFDVLSQIADMITSNMLFMVFFGLFILRLIFGVFYRIKKKGGL